jgi:hypothetical protein
MMALATLIVLMSEFATLPVSLSNTKGSTLKVTVPPVIALSPAFTTGTESHSPAK